MPLRRLAIEIAQVTLAEIAERPEHFNFKVKKLNLSNKGQHVAVGKLQSVESRLGRLLAVVVFGCPLGLVVSASDSVWECGHDLHCPICALLLNANLHQS